MLVCMCVYVVLFDVVLKFGILCDRLHANNNEAAASAAYTAFNQAVWNRLPEYRGLSRNGTRLQQDCAQFIDVVLVRLVVLLSCIAHSLSTVYCIMYFCNLLMTLNSRVI